MSATTETPVNEGTASEEIIISDDSKLADGPGVKVRLRNLLAKSVEAITEIRGVAETLSGLYKTVATSRAGARSLILLADGEPDWTGSSQTYKQEVNLVEAPAFEKYSDSQKRSFDSNVRSHMRRGVLDETIVEWVRANRAGMDKVEKGKERDSATFKAEMRRQYDRTSGLPNPIKCPDHWAEVETGGNGGNGGGSTAETPAQKVNAAAVAIAEMGGVTAIGHLHDLATKLAVAQTAPNAEVEGGRKRASDAWIDLGNLCKAAGLILGNANLTGDALAEAQKAVEKYSYTG